MQNYATQSSASSLLDGDEANRERTTTTSSRPNIFSDTNKLDVLDGNVENRINLKRKTRVTSKYFGENSNNDCLDETRDFVKDSKKSERKQTAPTVEVKKSKQRKKPKNVLGKIQEYTESFRKVCVSEGVDVDPDHLQLAIAMSQSLSEGSQSSSNPSNDDISYSKHGKILQVRRTLQQFGFKIQSPLENVKIHTRRRNCPLFETSTEQKNQHVNNKISQILFENFTTTIERIVEDYQVFSSVLEEVFARENHLILESHRRMLDKKAYYVSDLFEMTSSIPGFMLKNWSIIPGREKSPERDIPDKFIIKTSNIAEVNMDLLLSGCNRSIIDFVKNKQHILNESATKSTSNRSESPDMFEDSFCEKVTSFVKSKIIDLSQSSEELPDVCLSQKPSHSSVRSDEIHNSSSGIVHFDVYDKSSENSSDIFVDELASDPDKNKDNSVIIDDDDEVSCINDTLQTEQESAKENCPEKHFRSSSDQTAKIEALNSGLECKKLSQSRIRSIDPNENQEDTVIIGDDDISLCINDTMDKKSEMENHSPKISQNLNDLSAKEIAYNANLKCKNLSQNIKTVDSNKNEENLVIIDDDDDEVSCIDIYKTEHQKSAKEKNPSHKISPIFKNRSTKVEAFDSKLKFQSCDRSIDSINNQGNSEIIDDNNDSFQIAQEPSKESYFPKVSQSLNELSVEVEALNSSLKCNNPSQSTVLSINTNINQDNSIILDENDEELRIAETFSMERESAKVNLSPKKSLHLSDLSREVEAFNSSLKSKTLSQCSRGTINTNYNQDNSVIIDNEEVLCIDIYQMERESAEENHSPKIHQSLKDSSEEVEVFNSSLECKKLSQCSIRSIDEDVRIHDNDHMKRSHSFDVETTPSNQSSSVFVISDDELEYSIQHCNVAESNSQELEPEKQHDNPPLVIERSKLYRSSILDTIYSIDGSRNKSNTLKTVDPIDDSLPDVYMPGRCKAATDEGIICPNVMSSNDDYYPSKDVGTPKCEKYTIKTDNVTPMVDYKALDSPSLREHLAGYGLKPLKRKRAVQILEHIYEQTHPLVDLKNTGKRIKLDNHKNNEILYDEQKETDDVLSKNLSDIENPPSLYRIDRSDIQRMEIVDHHDSDDWVMAARSKSSKLATCDIPLNIVFHNYLSLRSKLRDAILCYEPVDVDVIHRAMKSNGYRFNSKAFISFMDKKCITIKTSTNGWNAKHNKK